MKSSCPKLSQDDQRAIDFLLDDGLQIGHSVTKLPPAASQQRLFAAERLFQLIGEFRAEEPPVNLVASTMARIDQAAGRSISPTDHHTVVQQPAV